MRGLGKLAWTEFRLNLRDPNMSFWSLAFPALWMGLFGALFSEPMPGFGYEGLNYANFLLPGGIGLVIVCSSFIGVPITLTSYRENGVLKRLRVTPVKTATLALSYAISQVVFIAVGIIVLFAIGKLFFDVQVLGSWWALLGVMALGIVCFLAMGSAIGSVAPSWRGANIIVWIMFMPMLFLSEMFLPIGLLPEWAQPIARALPLTPINTLLRDIVYGLPLEDLWRFGVSAAWIAAAAIVTVKFFRWE